MPKKPRPKRKSRSEKPKRRSPLVDTRVIYCGDNLEKLKQFPDACVDLIYIDPPFNSNRNYEVFWGETRENRTKGFFVAFDYSRDTLGEIDGFFRRSGKSIIALTVKEILDEEIAKKLA